MSISMPEHLFSGSILEVSERRSGSSLAMDHTIGATAFAVADTSLFDDAGGIALIGTTQYTYLSIDYLTDTLLLSAPLSVALDDNTQVWVYPYSLDKWALVQVDVNDDAIYARVPHYLAAQIDVGMREESDRESVLVAMERGNWIIQDVIALEARLSGDAISDDTTIPNPPTALTRTSTTYTEVGGEYRVSIVFSWTPPDLNTDGSLLHDLSGYDIQYQIDGSSDWVTAPSVSTPSIVINNLVPGRTYTLRVCAKDIYGNLSAWATASSLTAAVDTTAPSQPSPPTLTSARGIITVTHAWTKAAGGPLESDTRFVEVHASQTSGFTRSSATFKGALLQAGSLDLIGLAQSGLWYVVVVATDSTGNKSVQSTEVSQAVVRIAGPDLLVNSVTGNELDFGTVKAQNLALGIRGTNLVPDPSFEDLQPAASPTALSTSPSNYVWYADSLGNSGGAVELRRLRGRSGAWSVSTYLNGAGGTSSTISAAIAVVPGLTYKLSFYAMATTVDIGLVYEVYGGSTPSGTTTLQTLTPDADVIPAPLLNSTSEPFDPTDYTGYTFDYTAPVGVNYVRVRLGNTHATGTGAIVFDDVALVAKGGSATEITPAGIRLFDDEGLEVGAFVSNRPNYFSVSRQGGIVATIDEYGAIAGTSGAFTGDQSTANGLGDVPAALSVGGQDYSDRLWAMPQGIIAQVLKTNLTISKIRGEYGIYEISFTALPGRYYRVACWGGRVKPTTATTGVTIRIRRTSDGTTPGITSFVTREQDIDLSINAGGSNLPYVQGNGLYVAAGGSPALIRNIVTLAAWNPGATDYVDLITSSGYPLEAIIEDVGPDVPDTWIANSGGGVLYTGGSDSTGGGSPTATKKSYTQTWTANSSQTRRGSSVYGNNTVNTSAPTGYTLAGYYSSSNGNQYTYLGFTSTGSLGQTIGTAISGATLTKVELYVRNAKFYANAGGSQRFSMTTLGAMPSSGAASATIGNGYTGAQGFSTGQGKWIVLTSAAITALTSGGRVAIIGPGASTSNSYYSTWYDHVGTGAPQLRLTYTK